MQLTITKVIKRDTDKAGNKLISKQGKPYARASIQTVEYGAEWLGGFFRDSLVEGAKIEAEVTEREYNGKKYKDFTIPKQADKADAKLEQILNILTGVKMELVSIRSFVEPKKAVKEAGYNVTAFDEPVDSIHDGSDEEPPF